MAAPSDLRYFLETAHSLNLSRASERLGISQPSLSTAIKRLEHSIGTTLLIRHKRGVSLTQAGKQLLAHAKQLLQYWDEVKAKALASHHDVQGNLVLGCHPSVGLYYLSTFLPELLAKNPKLQIQLKHDLSRRITEQVINIAIDVGIVVNPSKHPDLIIRKIRTDEVTFWASKLVNNSTQHINSDEAIILCNPELTQTQALLAKIKRQGIHFKRVVTSDNLDIIADLTAHGAGIGILPTSVAMANHAKNLKCMPNMPIYVDEICVIYRHENREVKAVQTVIKMIKEAGQLKK